MSAALPVTGQPYQPGKEHLAVDALAAVSGRVLLSTSRPLRNVLPHARKDTVTFALAMKGVLTNWVSSIGWCRLTHQAYRLPLQAEVTMPGSRQADAAS